MTDTQNTNQSPAAASAAAGPPPGPHATSGDAPAKPRSARSTNKPGPGDNPGWNRGRVGIAVAVGVLVLIAAAQAGVPWTVLISLVLAAAVIAVVVALIRRHRAKKTSRLGKSASKNSPGSGADGKPGPGRGPAGTGKGLRAKGAGGKPGGAGPAGPGGKPRPGPRGLKAALGRGKKNGLHAARSGGFNPRGKPGGTGTGKGLGAKGAGGKPGGAGPAGPGGKPRPGPRGLKAALGRGKKNGLHAARSGGFNPRGKPGGTGTGKGLRAKGAGGKPGGAGPVGSGLPTWHQMRVDAAARKLKRSAAKAHRIRTNTTRPQKVKKAWHATTTGAAAGLVGAAAATGYTVRGAKKTGGWFGAKAQQGRRWWARRTGTADGPTIDGAYTTGPTSTDTGTGWGAKHTGTGYTADAGTGWSSYTPPTAPPGALSGARYPQTAAPVPANTPPRSQRTFTPAAPAWHRPYRTAPSQPSTTGGKMSHHATQGTVEAAGQMAAYQPKNLLDIVGMSHAAPGAIASLSQAFTNLAAGLEGTPAAASADAYRQVAAQLAASASSAAETGAMLEAAHQNDLDRIRNPRPAEHMADFSQNQS